MFSRSLSLALAMLAVSVVPAGAVTVRICADANNLPFSNAAHAGFENRIAETLLGSMGATVQYVWWDDRRAAALDALRRNLCDLVPGTLAGAPDVATTPPYFRSSYAFVTRVATGSIASFDDPRLRAMKIGIQSIGDDGVAPPAVALLHRGLGASIRPYTFHGHLSDPDSAAAIVADVARGKIDAAILWGPFAGYFAERQTEPLTVTIVKAGPVDLPMTFDVAMATRADDRALLEELVRVLVARRPTISAILAEYHVPMLHSGGPAVVNPP